MCIRDRLYSERGQAIPSLSAAGQKNGRHHCLPLWTFPSKGHLLSASSSSGCEWHQIRPKSCSCRNALRCWYQHSAISEAKLSYSSLLLHDLSSKSISSFAERIIFFLVRLSRTFFTILFFIYRHFCPIPPFRTLKQNRRPIFCLLYTSRCV